MHSAALMLDGRILIAGGRDSAGSALDTVEIFDTAGASFSTVDGALTVARVRPHLRVLFDGKVQIIGGSNDGSMEIYDPLIETIGAYAHVLPESDPCTGLINQILSAQTRAALFYAGSSDASSDRSGHTITELPDTNQALVAGGVNSSGGALSSISVLASSAATVTTDLLDYAPGDVTTITGRGFQPGETVRLKIHEDPHTPQERGFDTTADADGNFSGMYLVQDNDLNMKFIVGARGLTSGYTAQTTFTDSNNFNVTPLTQSVEAGSTNTFVWMFTAQNAGNEQTTTFTVPAGWTAPQVGAVPGQVTVAGSGGSPCNVSLQSIVGMIITIRQSPPAPTTGTCGNNTTFTLTYSNATAPTPVSPPQTYTFTNQHGQDPTVTVTAPVVRPTTTTVASNNNPSTYGGSVTFTATVTAAAGNPSSVGTVTFKDGGSAISGCSAVALSGNTAGCTTSTLSAVASPHSITAEYSGMTTGFPQFSASTSPALSQGVNKKTLTASIVGNPTKTYDGNTDATLTQANFTLTGLVGSESFTVTKTTGSYNNANVALANTVSTSLAATDFSPGPGTLAGNYNLPTTATGAGTIEKCSATWTTNPNSKTYGDLDPVPLTTGSGSNFVAADGVTATYSRVAGENASPPTYHITAALSATPLAALDNYIITNTGAEFTINKRLATWTTNPDSKTYGDLDPSPLTTGSGRNFIAADGVTATYSRVAGENASPLTYHITAALSATGDLNNYIITNDGAEFTINKRLATWTTNPNSKTYGDLDPVPLTTGSGSNFVAADNVTATYSRVAGENASPPTYHITATLSATGDLNNYIITNDGAEFTINKRLATWTTNANSKTYGDLDPVPLTTGSGINFVAADGVTATYSRVAGENASPPTYHITATLSATGDAQQLHHHQRRGRVHYQQTAGDLDYQPEQQDLWRSGSGTADHGLRAATSSRPTA